MTRETKVGIVVSCSFLGLLGVVVTSKLRGERPPDREEMPATTAALAARPKAAPDRNPTTKIDKRSLIERALGKSGWVLGAGRAESIAQIASGDNESSPSPSPSPGDNEGGATGKPASEIRLAPAPTPPQPQPEMTAPVPDKPGEEGPAPSPTPLPKSPGIDAAAPPGGEASPADIYGENLGALAVFFPKARAEHKRNTTEIGAALTEKAGQIREEAAAVSPPPSGAASEVKGEESKTTAVEVPPPPAVEPTDETKKALIPLPSQPAESAPDGPKPPPAPEGVTSPPGVEAPLATPPEKKEDKPKPDVPATPILRPVRAPTAGGEAEEAPGAASPDKRLAPAPVLAPVAARTTTTPKPKVEVFSVEEYAVQAGDTFATISNKKYHSEKYAEALRLFNANDALLSDAGRDAAINLQPGQTISIPDLTILEKRYSHAIQGLPAGGALVPEGTSRKTAFDVHPVVGLRAVPGAVPTYEIRQEGVTMREIAAQTLGNGDRWNEILRLNKEYNPERALPVGVVLKLPADARVPAPVPAVP